MAIIRHDPFRDLFRLQDSLFRSLDGAYGREEAAQSASPADWSPLVDVFEDQDGITLEAELPGIPAANVDIQIEGNSLHLRGERKLEKSTNAPADGYRRLERAYGSFSRAFTLPTSIDAEHVTAESKDGILRIRLPKKAETKPRQVKIQVETQRLSGQTASAKQ